ncbi:MAG TPA: TRAM domain-containing protein [Pseudonocardiaceae bacterium]|nr:TRAM domain-containing protein [Pseudonocardiaceae bacterium]
MSDPPQVGALDWTGRRCELVVGPVAHGGHCVGRVEGRVVFVRHALPGERVVVEITEDRGGSFCRGDAVTVLAASPDRVTPPCSLARPGGCGGCDWQHASPAAARELKAAVVTEQLRRLAGLHWTVTVEELPGGPLHWRTRLRLAVDQRGRAGLRGHRGHQIVRLDAEQGCAIAVPGLLDGVLGQSWPAGVGVEVIQDDRGAQHVATRESLPRSRGFRTSWRIGGQAEQQAAGRAWAVRADGFWQVHPAAASTLAAVVGAWADAPAGGVAWDLYGGVGLFAAVLAEQVGERGSVLLVEASRSAIADARTNLADLPQVRPIACAVERLRADPDDSPDVVVLDPPRKGAGRQVVAAIADRRPDRVVYVACDPAALARDVAIFAEQGYRLTRLRAFDAFPMTHHVECVALLEP